MKLPPKVHRKGPSLYYVHRNKWHRLCAADAPEHVLHGELWRILRQGTDTLAAVMADFRTHRLPRLKVSTQQDYEYIIESRLLPIFGHMRPDDLTSQDIAYYLDQREREGHPARGNKEIAVLSSIYSHGMRIRACRFNPAYGVRRNRENARTYYIDDESLRLALRHSDPSLRHLIWATYLTGFRQRDMRNLTRDNLTPEGIKVVQSKDGKHELRQWTPSLRKVVRRALARSRCDHVFTNERGQHYSLSAVQCAMRRMKAKTGIEWRFHDIRAKAESDHETGLGLMRRYTRARKLKAVR